VEQFLELLGWGDFRWSYLKKPGKGSSGQQQREAVDDQHLVASQGCVRPDQALGSKLLGYDPRANRTLKREHGVWESPSKSNHGVFG